MWLGFYIILNFVWLWLRIGLNLLWLWFHTYHKLLFQLVRNFRDMLHNDPNLVRNHIDQKLVLLRLQIDPKLMWIRFHTNPTIVLLWFTEGWHFTHICKALAWPHRFIKRGGLSPYIYFNLNTFYWSVSTKPGMRAVTYLCVRGIDLPLYTILIFDFGTVLTVWFCFCFCFFVFFLLWKTETTIIEKFI